MEYIKIDNQSETPKYRQIIASILDAIESGVLKRGDKIPSLNEIRDRFELSRDTVLAAFNELKEKKIISATPGKGYYIKSLNTKQQEKIFLLFDELNTFKEDLYQAIVSEAGKKADIEIYFHHFNRDMMKRLIEENKGKFTSYIIMPGSIENIHPILKHLPFNSTYILDRKPSDLQFRYGMVYQDFTQDIYNAMQSGQMLLMKYTKMILVSPQGKEPEERITSFERFCTEMQLDYEVLRTLENRQIKQGEVYFVVSDRDLVNVIKQAEKFHLKLGKNLGIVSFNDTMLKEVVAGGITTISTDFAQMGKSIVQMVLNKKREEIKNPSKLLTRSSL